MNNEKAPAVEISVRQHPQKALKIAEDNQKNKRLVTYFSMGIEVTPIARQITEKAYLEERK